MIYVWSGNVCLQDNIFHFEGGREGWWDGLRGSIFPADWPPATLQQRVVEINPVSLKDIHLFHLLNIVRAYPVYIYSILLVLVVQFTVVQFIIALYFLYEL